MISIILSGIGLRCFHYFYDRSLWLDELYLSSSIPGMKFTDLFSKTLDYGQKAPVGFLFLVKCTTSLFGFNEMSLRLIPLLSGISALILFYKLCQKYLGAHGQAIAVAICAFAPALIYHSVEIKQYATEFLMAVVALYLFKIYSGTHKWKENILWGIFGAILIWFSFSVIFILTGIIAGVSLHHLIKKDWKMFFFNLLPFSIWMMSFAINYLCYIYKQESDWVLYFFKVYDNFMPLPPRSLGEIKWFYRNTIDLFDYPLGMNWKFNSNVNNWATVLLTIFPFLMVLTGVFVFYKRQRQQDYALILTIVITLFASGLHMYPLIERFWLFLSPIFIILLATGFGYYQLRIKRHHTLLAALIILSPFFQSLYFLLKPEKFFKHKKSYQREALSYIDNRFKNGDAVYIYWNNNPGYRVYKNIVDFKFEAITGLDFRKKSNNLAEYNQNLKLDFNRFSGKKRVWVIYNTQYLTDIGDLVDTPGWYYKANLSPSQNILAQFKKIGTPISHIIFKDLTVYLFEI